MKKLVMLSIALLTAVPAFSIEVEKERMKRDIQWRQKEFQKEIQRPVKDLITLLKKNNKTDQIKVKEVTDLYNQVGGPTPLEQIIMIARGLGSDGQAIARELQESQMEFQRMQFPNRRLLLMEGESLDQNGKYPSALEEELRYSNQDLHLE